MQDVDVILDFLEEYGLLRPPSESAGDDPRTDRLSEDEQARQLDWEALIDPSRTEFFEAPADVSGLDADILGGLGRAKSREVQRDIKQWAESQPWERCAWYAPLHFYGPRWGIYVREDCVLRLAIEIGAFAWDAPPTQQTCDALKLAAFFTLFLHEHFHHKLESFGIRLALADRVTPDHYIRYNAAVYRPTFLTDENLEEALANADAYRRLGDTPYSRILSSPIRRAVRRWMKWRFQDDVDPPGYKRAAEFLNPTSFEVGTACLQTQVLEATLKPSSNPRHWNAGRNMLRSAFSVTSDIYVVVPASASAWFPITGHPYTVPVHKAEQWLRKNGFKKLAGRGKGDHERFSRHDGLQVGLDGGARELSRNIERQLAKSLGLSQRDLRIAISEGRVL